MKKRSSVDEVDTAQVRQEGQGLIRRRCLLADTCTILDEEGTLWREREQEQCRWRCCEEIYRHTFLS